jgi:hypothetical protein
MQQVKQGAGDVHAVFWSGMPLLDLAGLCHPRPAASFVYLLIVFLCCWIQPTQDHHKQVS